MITASVMKELTWFSGSVEQCTQNKLISFVTIQRDLNGYSL